MRAKRRAGDGGCDAYDKGLVAVAVAVAAGGPEPTSRRELQSLQKAA